MLGKGRDKGLRGMGRGALRSALPQVQSDCSSDAAPIDRSRALINRLSGRQAQLDLLEADA